MTSKNIKDPAFLAFQTAIRERLGEHLKKIILFGSRARGDDDPESDYDVLLVVDEVTREINDAINEVSGSILCEQSVVFGAIAVSETEFDTRLHNPLLMNVRREGVVL